MKNSSIWTVWDHDKTVRGLRHGAQLLQIKILILCSTNRRATGTHLIVLHLVVDIICIVRPIPSATNSGAVAYRVAIAVKNGIRNFTPLDFPVVLQRDDASRDLLLLKRKYFIPALCTQEIAIHYELN